MAPPITGTSYTVGLYRWRRGKRKELSMRAVVNGEPVRHNRGDTYPDEAADAEPLMLVTVKSDVPLFEVQFMLRELEEMVKREAKKKAKATQ